jgi:molybdate/tungstate transport system ATP-binding protein
MLSVRQIGKSVGELYLKGVSFDVQPGQYFVLLGASGVGKSVLLEIIAGLVCPDAGQICLDGKDITNERIQKRRIAMVFQDSALFPHMTVYDNIAYPLRCKGLKTGQVRQRVGDLAEDFAVSHLLQRRAPTLSGGETQRVSLARAVASQPRCLLLDEPICSLDVQSRPQIRSLLRRINAQGLAIVNVTHDYTEAVSLGTHIAVMEDGRIAQAGTIQDVFQRPKSEFVARFVGIRNFFKGRLGESGGQAASTRRFTAEGLDFSVLANGPAGAGFLMVRSEDVTVSNARSRTSARNHFQGTIIDILPAAAAVEVVVDIGLTEPLEIVSLVTAESVSGLGLARGKKVWVSFKASAVKYVGQ